MVLNFAANKKFSLHLQSQFKPIARVAELVDALVSNTNDSNIVPVRSRPRVQKASLIGRFFHFKAFLPRFMLRSVFYQNTITVMRINEELGGSDELGVRNFCKTNKN